MAERTGRQPVARRFESVAQNVQAQTVCRRRRSCGRTWGWWRKYIKERARGEHQKKANLINAPAREKSTTIERTVGRDQQAAGKSKRTFGKEIRMNDVLQIIVAQYRMFVTGVGGR